MPRDEPDPSVITNEPRKRTLSSYVRNQDNISGDRDQYVKRIKQTVNPGVFSNRIIPYLEMTRQKFLCQWEHLRTHQTIKVGRQLLKKYKMKIWTVNNEPHNIHTKCSHLLEVDDDLPAPPPKKARVSAKKKIFESSEEEDETPLVQPRKKVQVGTKQKNQSHHRDHSPTVDEVNSDSEIRPQQNHPPKNKKKKPTTDQLKKSSKSRNNTTNDDSEIEVIEKTQETPEKELGMSIQ